MRTALRNDNKNSPTSDFKLWYDEECRVLKRELNALLRKCKKHNFEQEMANLYSSKRNAFYNIKKEKQKSTMNLLKVKFQLANLPELSGKQSVTFYLNQSIKILFLSTFGMTI